MPMTLLVMLFPALVLAGCGGNSHQASPLTTGKAWMLGYGGNAESIVVDPLNPQHVFAVTDIVEGGYESTDGGEHWHDFSPLGATVLSIAFDPQHPRVMYVGGDEGCGVLKSTNGGTSWRRAGLNGCIVYKRGYVKKPATGESVSAFAIGPGGRIVYVGSTTTGGTRDPGVFKSTDAGGSWRQTSYSPGGEIPLLLLDPNNPRTLYTWTQGVFKSTDGGVSWKALSVPGSVDTLAIDPHNPQSVYAGAGFSGAVLKSTDGGASWRIVGLEGDDVEALALDPRNPRAIYAGTLDGIFRSSHAGKTWDLAALQGKEVWALGIAASGRVLYASTEERVYRLSLG